MDIRQNIKIQAKEHNITLEEVSKKMGITSVTLYRNIAGNITLKSLEAIAGAIGCSVADFFRSDDNITFQCPHCGKTITLKIVQNSAE